MNGIKQSSVLYITNGISLNEKAIPVCSGDYLPYRTLLYQVKNFIPNIRAMDLKGRNVN